MPFPMPMMRMMWHTHVEVCKPLRKGNFFTLGERRGKRGRKTRREEQNRTQTPQHKNFIYILNNPHIRFFIALCRGGGGILLPTPQAPPPPPQTYQVRGEWGGAVGGGGEWTGGAPRGGAGVNPPPTNPGGVPTLVRPKGRTPCYTRRTHRETKDTYSQSHICPRRRRPLGIRDAISASS